MTVFYKKIVKGVTSMKKVFKIFVLSMIAILITGMVGFGQKKTPYISMVSKGFQHKFWVTVKAGAVAAAKQYGVKINFVGPKTESNPKEQQDLLDSEINKNPDAIAFAAVAGDFSQQIKKIKDKKIPLVTFDSGVAANQAQGAVLAQAATDNAAAAAVVADRMFPAIKDRIAKYTTAKKARIAVIQHDNSQTGVDRSRGFVDRFKALADADPTTKGKYEVVVKVPVTQNEADVANEVNALKGTILALYNTNEAGVKGTLLVFKSAGADTPNTIKRAASDNGDLIICGFDSGKPQIDAIRSGVFYGSVTQDPYMIGYRAVELAVKAMKGEKISNVDTGAKWYDKTNIDKKDIAALLYN